MPNKLPDIKTQNGTHPANENLLPKINLGIAGKVVMLMGIGNL